MIESTCLKKEFLLEFVDSQSGILNHLLGLRQAFSLLRLLAVAWQLFNDEFARLAQKCDRLQTLQSCLALSTIFAGHLRAKQQVERHPECIVWSCRTLQYHLVSN